MFIKSAIFSLTAVPLALLAFAPAVSAQGVPRTTTVTYADLDLATDDGARELDRRIDAAAREVCALGKTMLGTRIASVDARKCVRNTKRQLQDHFAPIRRNHASRE